MAIIPDTFQGGFILAWMLIGFIIGAYIVIYERFVEKNYVNIWVCLFVIFVCTMLPLMVLEWINLCEQEEAQLVAEINELKAQKKVD